MQIKDLKNNTKAEFYDYRYVNFIETHKEHLLKTSTPVQVYNNNLLRTYVYQGDVIGLLERLKIEPEIHLVVMLLNNISSYTIDLESTYASIDSVIFIPNPDEINRLNSFFYTMLAASDPDDPLLQ